MIRVLIVEDSRVAQEILVHVLSSDPAIQVVGIVGDGASALQAAQAKRPDVITMDIHMPGMDGFAATRAIMENAPTPIVIVSASTGATSVESTFQAMEAGALAVVHRPPGLGHPDYAAAAHELVWTIKTMSEIKVVRRYAWARANRVDSMPPAARVGAGGEIELVAIGASTGGPPVLHTILSLLPSDLPIPLLIVQHIAPGFVEGFVEWLNGVTGFPLQVATHGTRPLPGHGYVAPDGYQMGVEAGPRIVLRREAEDNGLRPSVAYLFRSMARVLGPNGAGVLLSGMGRDGAQELKELRDRGGVTIVQDEASSIVHGMPGEAIRLGAAKYILPPESIAVLLVGLAARRNGGSDA